MPLSARQYEYLALAWLCMETEPKIDLEKFATVAGLASANSARELMRVTKKKLKEEHAALSSAVAADNQSKGTPKKAGANGAVATPASMNGKKRGRKGKADRDGEEEEREEGMSPSKGKKARMGLGNGVKVEVGGVGVEDAFGEEADFLQ